MEQGAVATLIDLERFTEYLLVAKDKGRDAVPRRQGATQPTFQDSLFPFGR